jgi:hypothetical protein
MSMSRIKYVIAANMLARIKDDDKYRLALDQFKRFFASELNFDPQKFEEYVKWECTYTRQADAQILIELDVTDQSPQYKSIKETRR